eukprot:scaffold6.g2520.t1
MGRGLLLACCVVAGVLALSAASTGTEALVGRSAALRISLQPLGEWAGAFWRSTQRSAVPKTKAETLVEIRAENDWKNDLTWLRCWLMCMALYFGVGAGWCYYAYWVWGARLFKPGEIPGLGDCLEQMAVSFRSMPLYSMLPVATEYVVEQGWTLAYGRVADVGLPRYFLYFFLYMASVEFCVYWQHRLLHSGWGYRWGADATGCGSDAGAWARADAGAGTGIAPVMGAGYHTIHHTRYNYNYGHYFTFVDRLFGTLLTPEEEGEWAARRRVRATAAAAAAALE